MTDHLANERTFLAYLRTALAFIAFGFVIARFSLFAREISIVAHIKVVSTHMSTAFGTGMAGAGIAIALYGAYRYAKTSSAIESGARVAMPAWAALAAASATALIGVVVAIALFEVR